MFPEIGLLRSVYYFKPLTNEKSHFEQTEWFFLEALYFLSLPCVFFVYGLEQHPCHPLQEAHLW